jgi:16S rRNA (guanine527-N7)-methyltransferase
VTRKQAPVADLATDRATALSLTPVSRETAARLDRLVEALLKWQTVTNLIAPSTVPHVWTRHIADSLQLLDLAPEARTWIDLGSGGGFPGLAIACALVERPGTCVHLVESNLKKAAFLREAVMLVAAPAIVHAQRIEEFVAGFRDQADVITARALAPLEDLLGYVAPLLKMGAQALLPKGQDVEVELTAAAKYWIIEAALVPSKTSPRGRIMIVRRLHRRDDRG